LSETQKRAEGQLEALPHAVIRHVQTFNENIQYLLQPEALSDRAEAMPGGLKKLLGDVAGVEKLSDGIKREVMRDQDTRRVSSDPLLCDRIS